MKKKRKYGPNYRALKKEWNPKGFDIHHIDGDKNNDSLENLQIVTPEEHWQIHFNQLEEARKIGCEESIRFNAMSCNGLNAMHRLKRPVRGYTFSKEHIENIRNKVVSDETRRRISKNHHDVSGENNPNYGKHWSDEWKLNQSIKKGAPVLNTSTGIWYHSSKDAYESYTGHLSLRGFRAQLSGQNKNKTDFIVV